LPLPYVCGQTGLGDAHALPGRLFIADSVHASREAALIGNNKWAHCRQMACFSADTGLASHSRGVLSYPAGCTCLRKTALSLWKLGLCRGPQRCLQSAAGGGSFTFRPGGSQSAAYAGQDPYALAWLRSFYGALTVAVAALVRGAQYPGAAIIFWTRQDSEEWAGLLLSGFIEMG